MRIVLGSGTYPLPNGVTNSVNTTIDGFISRGHELMVIAPDYGTGPVRPEHYPVDSSLVETAFLRYVINRKERGYATTAGKQIRGLIAQFDPDAFWLHTVTLNKSPFERAMLKSGKPTVLTFHTHVDKYGRAYGGVIGEQLMIKRTIDVCDSVDAVITPSHLVEQDLKEFKIKTPTYVIPTAIVAPQSSYTTEELRQRFHIPKNHRILLSVGRVVIEKNIFALFKMMAELIKTDPKVTLVMIGPGDLEGANRAIKKYKVNRHVILTGQVPADQTKKCYAGADVFVFASKSETQGLVVGEAMIVGTPVVALSSEIQPEMYPETVATVAKREEDLAPLVHGVLHNPDKANEMAKLAKKFIEESFSVDRMISRQVALFESLVAIK